MTQNPTEITAQLNYLVAGEAMPIYTASVGGGAARLDMVGDFELRTVRVRDARRRGESFDLDRQGFQLLEHASAVGDFFDQEERDQVYDREVEMLIANATGAGRVVVFDHTLRAESEAVREREKLREPATVVHNDYSANAGPVRVRDLLPPGEVPALLARRFAIVNVWRPIEYPVERSPLALCDATTVAAKDLVVSERRARERVGEILMATFNPAHHWYYFPRVHTHEAVLIKTYDSATDGRARFCIHTAFADPTAPAHARPRQSIESRAFAFF